MKDVSIEYAHIYTNQKINDEHKLSLEILGELRRELDKKGKSHSLVIMVDDYSFPDPSFSYDEFTDWLEQQGHKPDLMIRESQLIPLCDEVLKLITNDTLKQQIIDYIKIKKYPCSLFIAAWYLARLRQIKSPLIGETVQAEKLINILPTSFRPFEDRALDIIKNTPFNQAVSQIEYKFFEGRLVF